MITITALLEHRGKMYRLRMLDQDETERQQGKAEAGVLPQPSQEE
jgi:hypothetical protein